MLKREIIKKTGFWFILAALLILFLYVIDLFTGVVYDKIAPEFGRKYLSLALNEYSGKELPLLLRPHPYLTYENTPNYYKDGIRQHNNMGYRNRDDIILSNNSSTIQILVLGGSTTYGTGVDKPEDTWPAQLQKLLNKWLMNKSFTYKVEIINGGIPWATSAELLNHYIFRDRYLRPDIVMLHTGGNDCTPLMHNNYNPEYTHWRYIRSGGRNGLRAGEASIIRASNIIKFVYSIWYSPIGYSTSRAYIHTKSAAKLHKAEALNNVTNNPTTGFSRNLSLLIRNIKQDGAIPIYFQFYAPGKEIFSEKGRKALEIANKIINLSELFDVHKIALRKSEETAKAISMNHDIEYIEISDGDIPIEHFVDQHHVNIHGQKFKAEFIGKRIFPHILKLINKRIANKWLSGQPKPSGFSSHSIQKLRLSFKWQDVK